MKSSFKRNFRTWHWVTVCLSAVLLIGFASSLRSHAQSGSTYTITDLGTIASGTQSRAYGINNAGDIVGDSYITGSAPNHPFHRKNGTSTLIDIGTFNGEGSAYAVNSTGYTVGYSTAVSGQRAFLWHDDNNNGISDGAEMQNFMPAGAIGLAYDINDSNKVVGVIDASGGSSLGQNGYVWDSTSGTVILSGSATVVPETAFGINNVGSIVGEAATSGGGHHAFLLKSGSYLDLGTLTGSGFSFAREVSEDHHVVGYSQTPTSPPSAFNPNRGFVWFDANNNGVNDAGEMKNLGTFSGTNLESYAFDINANEQIVGRAEISSGNNHAVVWHDDNCDGTYAASEMKDLNSLISDATWTLQEAQSINDSGKIVGFGLHNGVLHAFLLTPTGSVPGPCSTPTPSPSPTPATTSLISVQGTGPGGFPATYGGTAELRATLYSNDQPVAGKTITFTFFGNSAGSAVTDASGTAIRQNVSLAGVNADTYPSAVGANFAGDSSFAAASQSGAITVNPASQTITVNTHAPANATYNTQFTVAATASSGLAVAYTSSGSCTNVGATYTMTSGTGTCNVIFNQAGNSNYSAAGQITEMVTAQKANQTITVNTHAPASATYNTQFTVAATASSSLAVSYSSSGGCTNSGATYTMTSGTTACTVKYDQAGDTNYNAASQVTESVTAQKANQTITVNTHAPASATYNTQFTVAATATSSLAVSYSSSGVCTNTGATYTMTSGTGTCTVKYDQAGDTNYNAASQITESVTAQKATATLTLGNLTQVFDGSAKFATASTTPPGLTVNITYSQNGNPVSSPTNLGAYAVSAVISDSNYQGSTTGTLNIVEPAPIILLETGTPYAAAVDSVTYAKGPFRVDAFVNFSTDHITRVIVFTAPLANPDSTLKVFASGHELQIENVGTVTGTPGLSASYIVFKLDPILTGSGPIDYDLTVQLRGINSNAAKITIIP